MGLIKKIMHKNVEFGENIQRDYFLLENYTYLMTILLYNNYCLLS